MRAQDDPWIDAHSPILAAKLHALGYINLRWNSCEFGYRALHATFMPPPFEAGWNRSHNWRPKQFADDLEKVVNGSAWPDEAKQAFIYAIDLVELCRINRNRYSHFHVNGSRNGLEFRMSKVETFSDIFKGDPIDISLETLRRTAEEIDATSAYIAGLLNMKFALSLLYMPGDPLPLPVKPRLPAIVWPDPSFSNSRPSHYRRRSKIP